MFLLKPRGGGGGGGGVTAANTLFWSDPSDTATVWQNSARTTAATAEGHPVDTIDDKSNNGNNMVANTNAPNLALAEINGLTALQFAGASSESMGALIGSGTYTQLTVCFVGRIDSIDGNHRFITIGGGSDYASGTGGEGMGIQVLQDNSNMVSQHNWTNNLQSGVDEGAGGAAFWVVEYDFANATQQMWRNGVSVDTGTATTDTDITPTRIGFGAAINAGTTEAPWLTGAIGEVAIFDSLAYSTDKAAKDLHFARWLP